jgi:hypothetical protein
MFEFGQQRSCREVADRGRWRGRSELAIRYPATSMRAPVSRGAIPDAARWIIDSKTVRFHASSSEQPRMVSDR